jgi:hypothetical protein
MKMSAVKIDLRDALTSPESRVLSGRDRGNECRKRFEVDRLDKSPETVDVIIPDRIYSLNTSFFLGLFGESVRKLTKAGFLQKYHFEGEPVHLTTVQEGIDRALKESSIFSDAQTG